jgi:copper chaperone CopZ
MSKNSVYFTVSGMDDKHDTVKLKRELGSLRGVLSVSIGDARVAVDYDSTGVGSERLQRKIETLGFGVSEVRLEEHRM